MMGNAQHQGDSMGKNHKKLQSASRTCTVAKGTGRSSPVTGSRLTTLPHISRKKKSSGLIRHLNLSERSATVPPRISLAFRFVRFASRWACILVTFLRSGVTSIRGSTRFAAVDSAGLAVPAFLDAAFFVVGLF